MFNFFRRKEKSLPIDLSVLGTDMHSHLIPGVDDGAKDMEDSLHLIGILKKLGYKKIITTPHVMSDFYPNSRDILLEGLERVRRGIKKKGLNIEVDCAAEYYMDEYFENLYKKEPLLTLPDNHVLVEMSFFSPPPNLRSYLFDIQMKGYKPILAHPERYLYYRNDFDKYEELKSYGCKLQVNILSLVGYYGKPSKEIAHKLFKLGLVDLLGTDLHHEKHAETLQKAISSGNLNKILKNHSFINTNW